MIQFDIRIEPEMESCPGTNEVAWNVLIDDVVEFFFRTEKKI